MTQLTLLPEATPESDSEGQDVVDSHSTDPQTHDQAGSDQDNPVVSASTGPGLLPADWDEPVAHEPGRDPTDEPLAEGIFELRRGALWEDVIHGCWFAGLMGVLLFPIIGLMLSRAGAVDVAGQLRGFLLSGMLLAGMSYARTRISSRMVIDPVEGSVHDAVRIGRTLYLQGSVPFDRIEGVELVRRECRRVLSDQDPEESTPLEGRGRLQLGTRSVALTNWVKEDYSRGAPWHRLRSDLRRVAAVTDAELSEASEIEPPVWELGRYSAWIAAIAISGAALVIVGA